MSGQGKVVSSCGVGLCQVKFQGTGGGKSSGTEDPQSEAMSISSRGTWKRKLQVEAALGSFVL